MNFCPQKKQVENEPECDAPYSCLEPHAGHRFTFKVANSCHFHLHAWWQQALTPTLIPQSLCLCRTPCRIQTFLITPNISKLQTLVMRHWDIAPTNPVWMRQELSFFFSYKALYSGTLIQCFWRLTHTRTHAHALIAVSVITMPS